MSETSGTLHPREHLPASDAGSLPALRRSFQASASPDCGPDLLMAAQDLQLTVADDLASAAAEWKTFEALADGTPFQTFAWLEKWQHHIGSRRGTVPAIVFGRARETGLLFILPLAIETRRGLRRLTWLGSELGDYNAPLLAKSFTGHPAANQFTVVWQSVVKLLQADPRYRFDLVDLQKMPEMVGQQENPFLRLKVLLNRSGAYVATLGRNWEEYYGARRSASTRKTARRKQRQLEEHGKLSFVQAIENSEAIQALETLIEQKTSFFTRMGVENIFKRSGYPAFYQAIATDLDIRDLVHVSRLDIGEAVGAVSVGLKFRDCYYLILSSYNPGEISRFGPGTAHLHELLRHCIGLGFRHFDFTIGDEPYKLDWADTKLALYDYLSAATLSGLLAATGTTLLRRTTRFIKQTPILWRGAKKIRTLTGRFGPSSGPGDE